MARRRNRRRLSEPPLPFTPPSSIRSADLLTHMPTEILHIIFKFAFHSPEPEPGPAFSFQQRHFVLDVGSNIQLGMQMASVCRRWKAILRGLHFDCGLETRAPWVTHGNEPLRVKEWVRMRQLEDGPTGDKWGRHYIRLRVGNLNNITSQQQIVAELFDYLRFSGRALVLAGTNRIHYPRFFLQPLDNATDLILDRVQLTEGWDSRVHTGTRAPLLTALSGFKRLRCLTLDMIQGRAIPAAMYGKTELSELVFLKIVASESWEVPNFLSAVCLPAVEEVWLEWLVTDTSSASLTVPPPGSLIKVNKLCWLSDIVANKAAVVAFLSHFPALTSLHLVRMALRSPFFKQLLARTAHGAQGEHHLRSLTLEDCDFLESQLRDVITMRPLCSVPLGPLSDITIVHPKMLYEHGRTLADTMAWLNERVADTSFTYYGPVQTNIGEVEQELKVIHRLPRPTPPASTSPLRAFPLEPAVPNTMSSDNRFSALTSSSLRRKLKLVEPYSLGVPNLTGKTAVVTGDLNGPSVRIALSLALANARVILLGPSDRLLEVSVDDTLTAAGSRGVVIWVPVDFSELDQVKKVAELVNSREHHLDILVLTSAESTHSAPSVVAGFDSEHAAGYLSHVLLIGMLWPLIRATSEASPVRVVSSVSNCYRHHAGMASRTDDIFNLTDKLYGVIFLEKVNLMRLLFIKELAARPLSSSDCKILAVAINPVPIAPPVSAEVDIAGRPTDSSTPSSVRDASGESLLWASTANKLLERVEEYQGAFVEDPSGELGTESKVAKDPSLARRLWDTTMRALKEVGHVELNFL